MSWQKVDGLVLLDKPEGLSSNAALQKVRRLYRAQKAGYGGTLDPFASGVLPIFLGEASKFARFLVDEDKCYRTTLRLGSETDTGDLTGQVTETAPIPPISAADWTALLAKFRGSIWQTPPAYSALKIDGKRAYARARAGEEVVLTPRQVHIFTLDCCACDAETATLRVVCSKGTYIRALVRDLGRTAGTRAHCLRLRRERVGRWAAPLYTLEELEREEVRAAALLPVSRCVEDLPRLVVPAEKAPFLRHGNDVAFSGADCPEVALFDEMHFLGVGRVAAGRLYPVRLCAELVT